MSFGLTNAPLIFMDLTDQVTKSYLDSCGLCPLMTFWFMLVVEENEQHLRIVL